MFNMKNFKNLIKVNNSWTLFLDRDGVVNKRLINDYVKNINEFEFLPGTKKAIAKLSNIFGKIFVVTNQRGIARGLMTVEDLLVVNNFMLKQVKEAGGRIDRVYFCPHDRDQGCGCRKPDIGMALKAKKEFPNINFKKSIMVGDSVSDIEFGKNAGMVTVHITSEEADGLTTASLYDFVGMLY